MNDFYNKDRITHDKIYQPVDQDYPFDTVENGQAIFEPRALWFATTNLENYANKKFDTLVTPCIVPLSTDQKRQYYEEENYLTRDIRRVTGYLHYWPDYFTVDGIEHVCEVLRNVQQEYVLHGENGETLVALSKAVAKAQIVLRDFDSDWIKEDYYKSPEGQTTDGITILEF